MTTRKKQKRQKDGSLRGFVFSSVSFVVICAALVFGMSVFFRVSNIEVIGADRYTAEEIAEASGIRNGDNLMLVNREAAAQSVYSELIYIGEVTVRRRLPNTVVVTVAESGPSAVVGTDSGFWLIDYNCRLLEPGKTQDTDSYIKIAGLSAVRPEAGATLGVADGDKPKAAFLKAILTAMNAKGLMREVGSIDLSNVLNAEFEYRSGRLRVQLGSNDDLDYKFGLLLSVIEKLDAQDTGTIDLSQEKKAQFRPA
ncbi:MAG: FtsQ-type POTRA domain-containing protein [Oscillospiraceae bacterium]|jgi:cell division protein FtsQ|nr:FtsQ-type POTRA domain-containing protein [Oscillospiraceae bacterium]